MPKIKKENVSAEKVQEFFDILTEPQPNEAARTENPADTREISRIPIEKNSNDGENDSKFAKMEFPSCRLERDHCGLLKNLEYEFDSLGFVNYKKLIPREFLVPNRQYFQNKKIPVPDSTENLPDNQLIVLLNGYRLLGAIRGVNFVNHKVVSATYESVIIETTVEFRGNYETDFKPVTYTALATASLKNTHSFSKDYLAEIAQNRGECRAIRGFLRIPILASDELGPQNEEEPSNSASKTNDLVSPHAVLEKRLNEKNTPFDKFKNFCHGKEIPNALTWEKISDIPKNQVLSLLDLMTAREKEKISPLKKDLEKVIVETE